MVSDAWSESPTRRCCGVDRRPIQRTATRARANQPVWRARGRRARLYEPVAALWAINGAGSAFVSPEAGDNRDKVGNHLNKVNGATKKIVFLSSSKRRTRWWSVQQWCPPMEEMEASSVAKTVACESNRLNPPQSAINNPLFSQAGLPNSLQPPGKPSVPPSHEHSDWLFLCLCRFLSTGNRPLRDGIPQARTVLCVRSVPYVFVYLSSTGIKKTSRLEWHVHPPYIPIRHRRAGSCAPIDRLHSAYGSWVFVSTSLVQELIWPCNDYDIVGRREPA